MQGSLICSRQQPSEDHSRATDRVNRSGDAVSPIRFGGDLVLRQVLAHAFVIDGHVAQAAPVSNLGQVQRVAIEVTATDFAENVVTHVEGD